MRRPILRCAAISAPPPFAVGRFVLLSSRDSRGGGPYIMEEAYTLAA